MFVVPQSPTEASSFANTQSFQMFLCSRVQMFSCDGKVSQSSVYVMRQSRVCLISPSSEEGGGGGGRAGMMRRQGGGSARRFSPLCVSRPPPSWIQRAEESSIHPSICPSVRLSVSLLVIQQLTSIRPPLIHPSADNPTSRLENE